MWRNRTKTKRSKTASSFLTSLSPIKKKKHSENSQDNLDSVKPSLIMPKQSNSVDTNNRKSSHPFLNNNNNNNNGLKSFNSTTTAENNENNEDEDEFFLAISSSGLRTGSCPEFFWYEPTPATNAPSGVDFDQVVPLSRLEYIFHYIPYHQFSSIFHPLCFKFFFVSNHNLYGIISLPAFFHITFICVSILNLCLLIKILCVENQYKWENKYYTVYINNNIYIVIS